uniref:Bm14431 n=1 Tax=Brugia malayi TaxID=6279 RepID=A0A1I9G576_BRUMA|nr:Bm14431 [Brugia malayi]
MPIHTLSYAICYTLYAIRHMPTHLGNIPNVPKRKALSHMIPHLPDSLPHHYQHSFQLTGTSSSTSMHCGQFR